ncbi:uncharacterized protein LOC143570491 [Bidens hawaiensis]|uniref:uncharacterized protein LOC143570491 n=1 Tax=Bidens hawaiensis TaxID=980011 RepID=UPI004049B2B0
MNASCLCARYQSNPKVSYLMIIKRIRRYLKGCPGVGLWYPSDDEFVLSAYSDFDYGSCKLNAKSTTVLWIQEQMRDYDLNFPTTPIFVDNSVAILITKNPKKLIAIDIIHTEEQKADLFTKAFDKNHFQYLLKLTSIKELGGGNKSDPEIMDSDLL